MRVDIEAGGVRGCVAAPPSKSYAHRMMICAALADGESVIEGIIPSEDMLATIDCITALGAQVTLQNGKAVIRGKQTPRADGAIFPCRESGSTLRFLIPAALIDGGTVHFTGTPRLLERGIGIYERLLSDKDCNIQKREDGLMLTGQLSAGEYTLVGNVSSQFVSGLLLALPLLPGNSTVRVLPPVESRAYIDITIDTMRRFGVSVEEIEPNTFAIVGPQRYQSLCATVEGDWSNAAALLALRELNGEITVTGLNEQSVQGDRICVELLQRLRKGGAEIDLSGCPDLGPVLFAVAAAGREAATFTGTARLKIKESDRAQAMAQELGKFGKFLTVGDNTVVVPAGAIHAPTQQLCGHNDHRIVMALSLLCTLTGGSISDAEAVRKSYPSFFDDLQRLGVKLQYGME